MSDSNRRYLIAKRPSGRVERDVFDVVEEDVPEIGEGEALVRVEWISVDPTRTVRLAPSVRKVTFAGTCSLSPSRLAAYAPAG